MAALVRLLAILLAALSLGAASSTSGRLPSGVRAVSIRSAAGVTTTVTRPASVTRIVKWFDALPPFVARPCPYLVDTPPTVTFVFHGPGTARTTAVDRAPGTCSGEIERDGRALADDGFVARVSRLVGVSFGSRTTTADNRRAARRAVGKLLRLVVLPPGSHRLAHAPGDAGGELSKAWLRPSYTNYFHRRAFWHVDASVDSVAAFIQAHRPRGSRSGGGQLSPPPRTLAFDLPSTPQLYQRQFSITIASLPDGSSAIRVDAFAVWNVERPAREVIPSGVREIDFNAHHTTTARQVATIVRWFDALPIAQPQRGLFNCVAVVGPYIRIAFRGAGRAVLARASVEYDRGYSYFCNAIQFNIGGHTERALIGGDFMRRVARLLRVRFG